MFKKVCFSFWKHYTCFFFIEWKKEPPSFFMCFCFFFINEIFEYVFASFFYCPRGRMRWWRHANCTFSSSSLLARVPPAGKDIAAAAAASSELFKATPNYRPPMQAKSFPIIGWHNRQYSRKFVHWHFLYIGYTKLFKRSLFFIILTIGRI